MPVAPVASIINLQRSIYAVVQSYVGMSSTDTYVALYDGVNTTS